MGMVTIWILLCIVSGLSGFVIGAEFVHLLDRMEGK